MNPGFRPLVFVAMPFGQKPDPRSGQTIDFDAVYERALRPAVEVVGLDVVRADEERTGGIIHSAMFERLLLSEIVVADVTIPNPNVFYELGIRHAARPRTTILIRGTEGNLPFDLAMVRTLTYTLDAGEITREGAADLQRRLAARLRDATADLETQDSPLFQLIRSYPGVDLPHDVTETFRDRVRRTEGFRRRLDAARRTGGPAGLQEIEATEQDLGDLRRAPPEPLIDLLLAYRDVEAFDRLIALADRLPEPIRRVRTVREQLAMALNRRNQPGDRARAMVELDEILLAVGPNPETLGIYGRIHKDMWEEAAKEGLAAIADAHLDEAIRLYLQGFETDPRDYYPGVNAATLLFRKGTPESIAELHRILPAVVFAIARRGGLASRNYWDVATVLETAVLGGDWALAHQAAGRVAAFNAQGWMLKTTLRNLAILTPALRDRGEAPELLDRIRAVLEGAMQPAPA